MRDIRRVVANLVRKYGTRDPIVLARSKGIRVFELPLPDNINGMYSNFLYYKAIILNESLDEWMKKIVAAHELGHFLLHKEINHIFLKSNTYYNTSRLECHADKFVAELLFPDELYSEYYDNDILHYTAVSEETITYFLDLKKGK